MCAASRAVHLQLTPNLLGESFIRALKPFIARRGFPRLLICDNAKTFTCKAVESFLLRNDIDIKFICFPLVGWILREVSAQCKDALKEGTRES